MAGDEAPIPAKDDVIIDSPFQCCVCLDLLYKPIVLACGHISCFWCVHRAMHGLRTSKCAMCRKPYNHFPSICQLLHRILLKLEPVDYKRREQEVLEEEKRINTFSPQFKDYIHVGNVSSDDNSTTREELETPVKTSVEESTISPKNDMANGCIQISVNDVLCGLCKEVLYKPAVLNCGHVYCECCLRGLGNDSLKCPDCQSVHPGGFPNVCLELNNFLEEQFPEEYANRNDEVEKPQTQYQPGDSSSIIVDKKHNEHLHLEEDMHNLHVGVGCDSCGMYPIKGKRYKCKDCKESIGFDLCGECYNSSSKLPGRFNQQHTPDHKFELDESTMLGRILFRSMPLEQEEIGEVVFDRVPEELLFEHVPENPDDSSNNEDM